MTQLPPNNSHGLYKVTLQVVSVFVFIFVTTQMLFWPVSIALAQAPPLVEQVFTNAPEGMGGGLLTLPYGGQVLFVMPCTCSFGILFQIHDYRSGLSFPIYAGLKKKPGPLGDAEAAEQLRDLDLTNFLPGVTYHTPQNFPFLFTPGHYQLGHIDPTDVGTHCVVGIPPLCAPNAIVAVKITDFGNGGPPLVGAFAVSAAAWAAIAATAAIAGYAILYPEGHDSIDPNDPQGGVVFEDLYFSGDPADEDVWLHVETPGRDAWPIKDIGGGGKLVYEYEWKGNVVGNAQIETEIFPIGGIKTASVMVTDGISEVEAICPPIIVANQDQPITDYATTTLTASCNVNKTAIVVDEEVTFSSFDVGGIGPYTYLWGGDVISTQRSTTTSFDTPGIKVASITVTDSLGIDATRYCSPVTVKATSTPPAPVVTDPLALKATCTVNKTSVNLREPVIYTVTPSGGQPMEPVWVNAELLLNDHRVDWMRPGQDDKYLINIFEGYDYWADESNWPEPGDMVKVTLRSVDGQYEITGYAEWPGEGYGGPGTGDPENQSFTPSSGSSGSGSSSGNSNNNGFSGGHGCGSACQGQDD